MVARRGKPIQLTAREFALLHFLMRNAGDVGQQGRHPRQRLGSAYEGSDSLAEAYIGYPQRKLDAPFGLSTLHTVHGLGYRLDPDQ